MVCGFGAQYAHDCRFRLLHRLHPRIYAHAMQMTNNGVTLGEALQCIGAVLPEAESPEHGEKEQNEK